MRKLFYAVILLATSLLATGQAGAQCPMPVTSMPNTNDLCFMNALEGANTPVIATAVQSDGKVLIGGAFSLVSGTPRFGIARLNTNGSVDNAYASSVNGFNAGVNSMQVQTDGKVVLAGIFTDYMGNTVPHIARLNTDGSLDGSLVMGSGFNANTYGVALQADGKIIVVGEYSDYNGSTRNGIVRLNTNGSIDNTFSIGTGFNAKAWTVAVQADGKIIVGGEFTSYNGTNCNRIARLKTNGGYDSTFVTGTGFDAPVRTVLVRQGGTIAVGGDFNNFNGTQRGWMAVLNANGSLNTGFVLPGTGFNNQVGALAEEADGKLLVGGSFTTLGGVSTQYMTRLNTNGSRDHAFHRTAGPNGPIRTLTMVAEGKFIAGGAFSNYDTRGQANIARVFGGDGAIRWTGASSTTWNDPGNWDSGTVPSTTDSITIGAGGSSPLVLNNTTVRGLSVQAGASFLLNLGVTLHVTGNLRGNITGSGTVHLNGTSIQYMSGFINLNILNVDNPAGARFLSNGTSIKDRLIITQGSLDLGGQNLRMRSSATGHAILATVAPGTLLNAFNMEVERYITPTAEGAWVFIGAMVQGINLHNWASPNNTYSYGTYNLGNDGNVSLYAYDPFSTLYPQNNGYVHGGTAKTAPAAVGRGFRIWTRTSFYQAGSVFMNRGTPVLGNFNFPTLQYCTANCAWDSGGPTNGWNLLANPYAAPIDWETGFSKTNLTNAWWTWDHVNSQWATYQTGVGGTNGATRIIAPAQSFFVLATAAAPALSVTPASVTSAVSIAPNTPLLREQAATDLMRLKLHSNGKSDEILAAFRPNADAGYNPNEDAARIGTGELALAMQTRSGQALTIASHPIPTDMDTLSLRVKGPGALTLSAAELPEGLTVYLLDRKTNSLRRFEAGAAPLAVTSDPTNKRYAIVVASGNRQEPATPSVAELLPVPNPATGSLQLLGLEETSSLTLTDALGRPVYRTSVAPGQAVALAHLPRGLYRWQAAGKSGALVLN